MTNDRGDASPDTRVRLTDIQRDRIEHARIDLALSTGDETGEHSREHQAALEHRLEQLLAIVDELTGGAERDLAQCRTCGATIHRPGDGGRWFSVDRIEVLEDPCDHEPELTGGAS